MSTRLFAVVTVAFGVVLGTQAACQKEHAQGLMLVWNVPLDSQCNARPGGNIYNPYGVLDLALTNQLWLFPEVKNVMPTIEEATGESITDGTIETNTVSIVSARVDFNLGMFDDGTALPFTYQFDGYTWPLSTYVGPTGSIVLMVQAVTPELGNFLDERMVEWVKRGFERPGAWITAYVSVEGLTQDRWPIQSNTFAYPIHVCWQCLIDCCSLVENPALDPAEELPCYPGQDSSICDSRCMLVSHHWNDYLEAKRQQAKGETFPWAVTDPETALPKPLNPCSVCPAAVR
ncbi:MAG: hypothetical protein FJ087_00715 [Deltaproteobacteria bacterium]|nr:hypothetical protein [Deltaproteobacteria bacterium]